MQPFLTSAGVRPMCMSGDLFRRKNVNDVQLTDWSYDNFMQPTPRTHEHERFLLRNLTSKTFDFNPIESNNFFTTSHAFEVFDWVSLVHRKNAWRNYQKM